MPLTYLGFSRLSSFAQIYFCQVYSSELVAASAIRDHPPVTCDRPVVRDRRDAHLILRRRNWGQFRLFAIYLVPDLRTPEDKIATAPAARQPTSRKPREMGHPLFFSAKTEPAALYLLAERCGPPAKHWARNLDAQRETE